MEIRTFIRITLPLAGVNALTQAARTVMSTVGPVLALQYGIGAAELGLFSAVLFASYGLTQIPAGIAIDRFGPRRVQAALCLVAATGFAVFAASNGMAGFVLGRLITGIGVAAGLIGMLKGNSQWFPRNEVAMATGLGMVVGTLGSFLVTVPAQAVLPFIGWRGVVWCCAAASLLIGLWTLLSVRDGPAPAARSSLLSDLRDLLGIVRAPVFRGLAPIACLLTVLNFTYLGLWAGPWLRDVAHLDDTTRAAVLSLYTVGLLLGAPLTGILVSAAERRRRHPMLVPALCTIGLIAVQVALACSPTGVVPVTLLWMAFAVLSSCGPAAYAAMTGFFPTAQAGRVSTAINTVTLALVFAMQIVIGRLVDAWPHPEAGGWSPQGYAVGLAVTIVLQTAALVYAWFRRVQPQRHPNPAPAPAPTRTAPRPLRR